MSDHIHQNQPVLTYGADLNDAELVVILLHGRGSTAEATLPLAQELFTDQSFYLIPQAAHNRWYPNSAFGPLASNEPDLTSALRRIDELVQEMHDAGFSDDQIAFGGFSQGACLASEYVARNARKYAGLFVFSGALIGPPGTERDYPGSFDGMPVFIGGSDIDPWVAHDLMAESAAVFERMGAQVDFRTYPGMAHTVNQDELEAIQEMLAVASGAETK